eukprot:g25016.t1
MGPGNMLAIGLKTCPLELAAPLAKLFQYSYNTGIYPTKWKIAQVCPVHKKQDKSKTANYRPISPLSNISNVMEDATVKEAQQHLFFLRWIRNFSMAIRPVTNFDRCTIESILSGCITAWYGNCSAQDRKKLQEMVCTAQT